MTWTGVIAIVAACVCIFCTAIVLAAVLGAGRK